MNIFRILLSAVACLVGLVIISPIVVVALPVWAIGYITRKLTPFLEAQTITEDQALEYCPKLGWKPKANLNLHCEAAPHAIFQVSTDSNGWRGKGTLTNSDILVFGDSFAWGYGVNDEEFFADLNPRLNIKSIGAPGYSLVHEYLWMEEMACHFKDKLIVWWIFDGNDLYDNMLPNYLHYRQPFVRKVEGAEEWEIVTSHVKKDKWPFNHEKNCREREKFLGTFGKNVLSERIYSACEFLIKKGHKLCQNAGGHLVVMNVPLDMQTSERAWKQKIKNIGLNVDLNREMPDEKIKAICSKLDVQFVSATSFLELSDHIPNEGHWNKSGHQKISKSLEGIYAQYILGKTP